jgi:hypothetical protein
MKYGTRDKSTFACKSRYCLSSLGPNAKHAQQTRGTIPFCTWSTPGGEKRLESSKHCKESTMHGSGSHVAAISTHQCPLSPLPTGSNQQQLFHRTEPKMTCIDFGPLPTPWSIFVSTTRRKNSTLVCPGGELKHFPCQRKRQALPFPAQVSTTSLTTALTTAH